MKFTESTIAQRLRGHFHAAKYVVSNVYVFRWESDVFVLTRAGMCYDIEIKITKADLKADFQKWQRHEVLEKGEYISRRTYRGQSVTKPRKLQRPNRFYFAVPKSLGVTSDDVPRYAGLLVVEDSGIVRVVKKAPLLHNTKLNLIPTLCDKFYYKWLKCKS